MTIPSKARYEARIAGGIALWDVSHLLPFNARKQKYRDPLDIDTIFVHHSGALGKPGFAGLKASARYMVEQRDPSFPSAGYTYWLSHAEERDDEGNLVIYRCSPDHEHDWHTGGKANARGVAVALQGNTSRNGLSSFQRECMEGLIPWVAARHPAIKLPKGLAWHSIGDQYGGRSKAACPGREAEEWLREYRSRV